MALPETIRVRLSSEAAGYVAMSPVVVRELPLLELTTEIVSVSGVDLERVREIFRRGSLVSGASRFRWEGLTVEENEARALLARLPTPDTSLLFPADRCDRVVFSGSRSRIEVSRDAARQRRLLRRNNYWAAILSVASGAAYVTYSYRDRADRFDVVLSPRQVEDLKEAAARLLKYEALARQIRDASFERVEFYAARG